MTTPRHTKMQKSPNVITIQSAVDVPAKLRELADDIGANGCVSLTLVLEMDNGEISVRLWGRNDVLRAAGLLNYGAGLITRKYIHDGHDGHAA